MELKSKRGEKLKRALLRLHEDLEIMKEADLGRFYIQCRDSTIKRFEFTIDLFWKYLKDLLSERFGVEVASPKGTIKECLANKIIVYKEFETLIEMMNDRNDNAIFVRLTTKKSMSKPKKRIKKS